MEKAVAASTIQIDRSELESEKPTVNYNGFTNAVSSKVSYIENSLDDIFRHDDVRVVKLEEYKQAADALAEAFAEDDVAMYFINTPDCQHWTKEEKWKLHVEILEYVTYAHILKGLVLTAGENYGCVALWCVRPFFLLRFPFIDETFASRLFAQTISREHSILR